MNKTETFRFVTAAAIGNFVEWYDFVIYAFLAVQISRNFFPDSSPVVGLLSTLAVFGAGFVFRPIGAAICGHLGDRFGRRYVLAGVVLSMSVATFLMGLIPSYQMIGVWAPILLVALRLIQSLSAGGEFGGVTSFLFEHADQNRRGLIGSVQPLSMHAAVATSVGLSLGITSLMSQEFLDGWGWRILFLISLPMGLIGLYIRLGVKETPEFTTAQEKAAQGDTESLSRYPVKDVITQYWRQILVATLACASWTAGGYVTLLYLPTYFGAVLGRPTREGLIVAFVGLAAWVLCNPVAGRISDAVARWKVMLTGAIATALVAVPAFLLLVHGSVFTAAIAAVVFAMSLSLVSGPTPAFMSELVPPKIRNSANSISYAIANTLFAGFAPFIVTWMIVETEVVIAPSFYLIGAQVLTILGLLFNLVLLQRVKFGEPAPMPERAPVQPSGEE